MNHNSVIVLIIVLFILIYIFFPTLFPTHEKNYGHVRFKTTLDGMTLKVSQRQNSKVYINTSQLKIPYKYNKIKKGEYSVYAEYTSKDKKWLYQTKSRLKVEKGKYKTVHLQFKNANKQITFYNFSIRMMWFSAGFISFMLGFMTLMGILIGGGSAIKNYFLSLKKYVNNNYTDYATLFKKG